MFWNHGETVTNKQNWVEEENSIAWNVLSDQITSDSVLRNIKSQSRRARNNYISHQISRKSSECPKKRKRALRRKYNCKTHESFWWPITSPPNISWSYRRKETTAANRDRIFPFTFHGDSPVFGLPVKSSLARNFPFFIVTYFYDALKNISLNSPE